MPPRTITWSADPHTLVKHRILRRYLGAWFPKLARYNHRLIFVDGFAGPGEYSTGEPGSPMIALNAAANHRQDLSRCELVFVLIEEDGRRAVHLEALVGSLELPSQIKVLVRRGAFSAQFGSALDALEENGATMAPALVMIDPFGVKGVEMTMLQRIARQPKSELLLSFMAEPMVRFLSQAEFEPHLDALFGCSDWREAEKASSPDGKRARLLGLFRERLRAAGFAHTLAFELRDDGNRVEYYIIHATNHEEGVRAFKDAMWSEDPSGGFRFSDFTDAQSDGQFTFAIDVDLTPLRRVLFQQFAGRNDVPVEEIWQWLLTNPFKETHLNQLLRQMEGDGLHIARPAGRRRTYLNKGIKVSFERAAGS